jgi:hypothetical protein
MAPGKRQVTMRWERAGKSHKSHKRDSALIRGRQAVHPAEPRFIHACGDRWIAASNELRWSHALAFNAPCADADSQIAIGAKSALGKWDRASRQEYPASDLGLPRGNRLIHAGWVGCHESV